MSKLKLNLGPQHPSTHGVLRLILELEGEKILSCEPDVGYLHRGMEKMAEKLSYIQYLPTVDRIDYLAGFFYSELLCRTVEKALKLLHTTSPSLLLLASLDSARAVLQSKSGQALEKCYWQPWRAWSIGSGSCAPAFRSNP